MLVESWKKYEIYEPYIHEMVKDRKLSHFSIKLIILDAREFENAFKDFWDVC